MFYIHLFSVWIYIYFILYIHKIIPFNPTPIFLIILIRDILHFIVLYQKNIKIKKNLATLIRLFFAISWHSLPLLYLLFIYYINYNTYNTKTKSYNIINSIFACIILWIIYNIFCKYNNLTVKMIYKKVIDDNFPNTYDYIINRFNTIFEFIIILSITLYINFIIFYKLFYKSS